MFLLATLAAIAVITSAFDIEVSPVAKDVENPLPLAIELTCTVTKVTCSDGSTTITVEATRVSGSLTVNGNEISSVGTFSGKNGDTNTVKLGALSKAQLQT